MRKLGQLIDNPLKLNYVVFALAAVLMFSGCDKAADRNKSTAAPKAGDGLADENESRIENAAIGSDQVEPAGENAPATDQKSEISDNASGTEPLSNPSEAEEPFVPVTFDVYELFKMEDEAEFQRALKEIPQPFQWMDNELIAARRNQYQEQLRAIRERYRVCSEPSSKDNAPGLFGGIGDKQLLYFYGLCRRLESGPEGCAVLKEGLRETYGQCMEYAGSFWMETVPFLMQESISEEEYEAFAANFCQKNARILKPAFDNCAIEMPWMLKALRVVLHERDKKECETLPEGAGRNFCRAAFERDMAFCERQGKEMSLPCLEKRLYPAVVRIANSEMSAAGGENETSQHEFFSDYYVFTNRQSKADRGKESYCDYFYEEKIVPACKALEESAVEGIAVYFP